MITYTRSSASVRYHELQGFTQWWLWLIPVVLASMFLYAIYQQEIVGEPFGNQPAPTFVHGLLLLFVVVPMIWAMCLVRLETLIDEEGIHYRWRPFSSSFNQIRWSDVQKAYVTRYSFVGYGYRQSRRYGIVYNASGQQGLQVILRSGARRMIGTQRPEELQKILDDIRPSGLSD